MTPLTLPQARIPLGWATLSDPANPGMQRRVPVEIDIEWMRAFLDLVARTGGVSGTDFEALISELAASPLPQAQAQQADPLMPAYAEMPFQDPLNPAATAAPLAEQRVDARVDALEANLHKLQLQVDGLLQGYQV